MSDAYADLHLHTVASDGRLTPTELVREAAMRGFSAIAITDHDTVSGIDEAVAAGRELPLEVIPGIELSTLVGEREIHILGYYINLKCVALSDKLLQLVEARYMRAVKMIEKLNSLGIDLCLQRVLEIAGGDLIGRLHIARVMVEKGYIANTEQAFTEEYIGRGGRAYAERYRLAPEEAISLVQEAGGVAGLAHPGFLSKGPPMDEKEILPLIKKGLRGIEVFYSRHSLKQEKYYYGLAKKNNLLVTGGSDYHGDMKSIKYLGSVHFPLKYVEMLAEEKNKLIESNL